MRNLLYDYRNCIKISNIKAARKFCDLCTAFLGCKILIYRIHQSSIWRYGSTLSGTLSLLFSPSGTKALMRQFVADAPKAHESLSTEARRVPVQGTPISLISVFIAIFRLDTICRFCELTGTADDSTPRKPLLSLGA